MLLEIQELLPTISDDKEIFTQVLTFDESTPYFISLEQSTEKVKDGKIETETFVVNLALLDPDITEIKTSKKEMKLIISSSEGDFIQYLKNGEANGFKNKIEIHLEDIDVARNLEEKFKSSIKMARNEWKDDLNIPSDDPGFKSWLSSRIHKVTEQDEIIDQKIEINASYKDYMKMTIKDKDLTSDLYFSLADIDYSKSKIKDGKSSFSLELNTKNGDKLISAANEKDGQKFENKIKLFFDNASQAKAMALALEQNSEMYSKIAEDRFQNYSNCSNCIARLDQILTAATNNNKYILSGDCTANLISKTEEKDMNHLLEWADFNPESIKMDYNSDQIKLTIKTLGEERFVTVTEDEKLSYTDELELTFTNLESARETMQILPKIVRTCEVHIEIADPEFIQNHFSTNNPFDEKYNQSLSLENGAPCTLIFASHEAAKDKLEEYKFNLYDLNINSIRANILRDKLKLELQTQGKQKIITLTNEKGESKFTDKVEMLFGSVKALRIAKATLLEMAETCKKE